MLSLLLQFTVRCLLYIYSFFLWFLSVESRACDITIVGFYWSSFGVIPAFDFLTLMECFGDSGLATVGCTLRKKRNGVPRRPHSDFRTLLHSFTFLPQSNQCIGSGSNEGNQNVNDTIVGSDGLGSENKLKVKLKFGGVTHTIQTNSAVEYSPRHRQKQVLPMLCMIFVKQ